MPPQGHRGHLQTIHLLQPQRLDLLELLGPQDQRDPQVLQVLLEQMVQQDPPVLRELRDLPDLPE